MARYRMEKDFLGKVKVPGDAYYGAETQRAIGNFPISGTKVDGFLIINYAIVKRAAAVANAKEGKLDREVANAIIKACDEIIGGKLQDQFPLDVFQAGAGTSTNMNLNEVIANRALEMMGMRRGDYRKVHPNDHVNMSQSTNDTYPTAIRLATYRAVGEWLLPSLSALEKALGRKAKEFGRVVKVGRTHLQDAVPMTLGQEFSGYASTVRNLADDVERARATMLELPLGGTAVGTGIGASQAYSKEAIAELDKYTGIRFRHARNEFSAMQSRSEELIVASALKALAVGLGRISNDLRLMSSGPSTGFGDITLPAVQPGSSIMPGKVNPSMAEMLNMVCFEVIGREAAIAEAVEAGQMEIDVFMPLIAHDLLYSIRILSNAVRQFSRLCVAGIRANEKAMRDRIEHDASLATALAPYIGYAKAARIARTALKEGKSVKEVCIREKVMGRKELDRILDPKRMAKA